MCRCGMWWTPVANGRSLLTSRSSILSVGFGSMKCRLSAVIRRCGGLWGSWTGGLTAVGARNDLEGGAVRVGKVDAAATVVVIDLARASVPWVGPVLETSLSNTTQDSVE